MRWRSGYMALYVADAFLIIFAGNAAHPIVLFRKRTANYVPISEKYSQKEIAHS